jgi:D-xylose transport system permease protein
MSDSATTGAAPAKKSLLETLEVDTRLLGMIGAFVLLCLVFNLFTDGRFLTPRNIFNLTIQTVSVAIMATGMVFVIVTRHIDLSVGSLWRPARRSWRWCRRWSCRNGSAPGWSIG